jgi:hypothetical protein
LAADAAVGDHPDGLVRAALLDTSTPIAKNVVPIRAQRWSRA